MRPTETEALGRRRFLSRALAGAAGLCLPFGTASCLSAADASAGAAAKSGGWIPLFNGKDLDGWTPKFRGSDYKVNYKNTFRVENGILRVVYDQYTRFAGEFGHLFFREPFSNYVVRLEYRFVGDQVPGGPSWAFRNSGIMIHSQPPETMEKDQEFPASIEVQLLGGDGTHERTTANLCTPSTNVVMGGKLVTQHCTESTSKTYHGDQWVTVEVEVRGSRSIRHLLEGKAVLEYSEPQLDEADAYAKKLLQRGTPKMIESGYLCLQAESHPVEFRKVELRKL